MKRTLLLLNILILSAFTIQAQLQNTAWSLSSGGTYVYDVLFHSNGEIQISYNGSAWVPLANYTVNGNTLSITYPSGADCSSTGTYNYSIQGDMVTWTLVNDPCEDRPVMFTMMVWTSISVGLNDLSWADFSVHPNPSNGLLYLEHGLNDVANVRIVDMSGRIVHTTRTTGERTQLDLSTLATGTYVLELIGADVKATQRVVLN